MRRPLVRLFVLVCLGGAGCTAPEAAPAEEHGAAPAPSEGTQRMQAELERLRLATHAEPLSYYYLNGLRADRVQSEIGRLSGAAQRKARFAYATERLNAGHTEVAIDAFEELLDEAPGGRAGRTREHTDLRTALAIAYLRLGEQQNCLLNHSADACIFPLRGGGLHRLRDGSRAAVEVFGRLLADAPQDYASRWLANVAYSTLGAYPHDVPEDVLIPGLDAATHPSVPRFPNVALELGVGGRGLSGSVALDDFDGDGHLDILTSAFRLEDPVRLYVSDGRGGFAERTDAAGLAGLSGGLNLVHADYDNDGDPDVLVLRGAWLGDHGAHPNSLLRNNGDGTFEDVTFAAGLGSYHPTQTAAWGDFDGDGWLDLFVGNEARSPWLSAWQRASGDGGGARHRSELFVNNGDGTFTEVASKVGVDLEAFVKGAVWGDVNNDGRPDLYVSVMGGPNRLYLNRGGTSRADWRFEESAARAGVHEPFFSFPAWFWDFDNDGWEDLFVAAYDLRRIGDAATDVAREYLGLPVDTETARLYRNNGDETFTDVTAEAGLDRVAFAMGAGFGDLDNDGFEDLYLGTGAPDLRAIVPNRMFRNVGGERFEEVTFAGGFGHLQKGHGIAFADLDRDGDQDVYAVMGGFFEGDVFPNALFQNPADDDSLAWITLRLEGRSTNRSAIGARIRIRVTDHDGRTRTFHRAVSTGGSFGASSLQSEIGLGTAARIDELEITWPGPSHMVDRYRDLAPRQVLHVVEGEGVNTLSAARTSTQGMTHRD